MVVGIGCQSALDVDRYAFAEEPAPKPPAMDGLSGASGRNNAGTGGSLTGAAATDVDALGGAQGEGGRAAMPAGGAQGGSAGREETPAVDGPDAGGTSGNGSGSLPPPGTCQDSGAWQVEYTDRGGTIENQISMILDVLNMGAAMPLSGLVFRYWFNADGYIDFGAELDYVSIDNGSFAGTTRVTFGATLGSHHGDISFVATDEQLVSNATLQVRLHTTNYDMLDQSNDFSYVAGANQISNRNIAVYFDGELVSGCEPAPP